MVQVKLNKGLDFPSLDDVLVDMKLAPEVLELPCPAYFREDRAKVLPRLASMVMTADAPDNCMLLLLSMHPALAHCITPCCSSPCS